MIIDTHCHLDFQDNPIDFANKYEKLGYVIIGVTNLPSYFEQGVKYVSNFKNIRLALGLHPLLTEQHTTKELNKFEKLSNNTSYIGEVGLDFSPQGYSSKEKQLSTFKFIMEVLSQSNKIISLHSRRAESEIFNYLIKHNIKNAIFHWYSGPLKLIDEIAAAGYYFSINPAMTISSNGKKIIERIPMQNILTETDGPFAEINGTVVKPEDIKRIFTYISDKRNLPFNQIQKIVEDNFFTLIKNIRPV